jgi:hypothetical protein
MYSHFALVFFGGRKFNQHSTNNHIRTKVIQAALLYSHFGLVFFGGRKLADKFLMQLFYQKSNLR